MVFNIKSNEVEEDGENEVLQVPAEPEESDNSDGGTASKPNKNFLSAINWQEGDAKPTVPHGDSFGDSDDDFENLRDKDQSYAAKSTSQTHDFFSEREGVGNHAEEDLDLFNLKSPSNGEFGEDLFNFKSDGDPNGDLFNLEDDSDSDEPVSGDYSSNNIDLLNLGTQGVGTETTSNVAVVDDMGVDLLNLSPGGSRDSQNVDLFSGTEKSPHRTMKRNKSADDVLSPGLHEDEDFFNQMGSRSSSSSRENVTSFTVTGVDSPTFDPYHATRSKSPDLGGNGNKPASPDLFDPFSSKTPSKKPSSEFDLFAGKPVDSKTETFDPFGGKLAQGSSSAEAFQQFGSKGSGTNLGTFDPFGTNSSEASNDLFGIGSSQVPSTTSQAQEKSTTDLFGDWGNSSASTLQPARAPSPTPQRKPNGPASQNKVKPAPTDPFSDFGNLKSSLPKASTTATAPSQQAQKKPGPSTSANPSWSRTAQQPSWPSGAKPSGSPKLQKKPNYAPSYSMSGGSGVFGNYGQKWSGECKEIIQNTRVMIHH